LEPQYVNEIVRLGVEHVGMLAESLKRLASRSCRAAVYALEAFGDPELPDYLVPILEWVRLREKVDADSRNLTRISSPARIDAAMDRAGFETRLRDFGVRRRCWRRCGEGGAELTQAARSASDTAHSVALELQCIGLPLS